MQKKYLIGIVVVLVIVSGLFLFGSGNRQIGNITETSLTPVISFSHSHGIAVDTTDATKVYIATHEGLYLLQNDKDLYQIGKTRDDLMGFSAHPTNANTFFSSGHPTRGGNIGFQKTTDGGITWERLSGGLGGPVDFHSMTVSQVNPDIVYGFYGNKLQRSIDGGRSWEYAKGIVAPISLSSDPKNESIIYASTQNGAMISNDKGDTWQSVSSQLEGGLVSVFVVDPFSTYILIFSEKLGGMGKSIDGGKNWEKLPETFGGEVVLYVSYSKSTIGIVYALTNKNSLYKSNDSGATWTKVQ
ncbi:MAG: hypothetical protein Q8P93_01550 [bacterium]|nr:hypothetical protein [bacterium]